LCGNFILPEPASYVFFYAVFNLRKLLYIITASAADPIVPAALKAASKTAFEEEGVAEPHPLLHHAGIL